VFDYRKFFLKKTSEILRTSMPNWRTNKKGCPLTDQSIERILRILQDGRWHNINELAEKTHLTPLKMRLVTDFLAKYTFVKLDPENKKMKISRSFSRFFERTSLETETVG